MNVQLSPVSNSPCFCEKIVPPACHIRRYAAQQKQRRSTPYSEFRFLRKFCLRALEGFLSSVFYPVSIAVYVSRSTRRSLGELDALVEKLIRTRGRAHVSYRIRIRVH